MSLFQNPKSHIFNLILDLKLNPLQYKSICKSILRRFPDSRLELHLQKEVLTEFEISKLRILDQVLKDLKANFQIIVVQKLTFMTLKAYGIQIKKIAKIKSSPQVMQKFDEVLTPNQEFETLKNLFCFWKKSQVFTKFNWKDLVRACLVIALVVFSTVYITSPKATIVFEPRSNRIERVMKINLNDESSKGIQLIPTRIQDIQQSYRFEADQSAKVGEVASFQAQISNPLDHPVSINPYTAFKSKTGKLYRNQQLIIVPPGSSTNPGQATALIKPDLYSVSQSYIGDKISLSKGSILTTKQFPELQLVTEQAIANLTTRKDFVLNMEQKQAALDYAKADFNQNIFKITKIHLAKSSSQEFILLENPQFLELVDLDYAIDDTRLSSHGEFFLVLKPDLEIQLIDQKKLFKNIKSFLNKQTTPNYLLSSIDLHNINIEKQRPKIENGESFDQIIFNIYATETFDVSKAKWVSQNLDPEKQYLKNLTIDQAKDHLSSLQNLTVQSVALQPFWAPTLPEQSDNINFSFNNE